MEKPRFQEAVEWIGPEDFKTQCLENITQSTLLIDIRVEDHYEQRPYLELPNNGPDITRVPNIIIQDALGFIRKREKENTDETQTSIYEGEGISLEAILRRRGILLDNYDQIVFICGGQPRQVHLSVDHALKNTTEAIPHIYFLQNGVEGVAQGILDQNDTAHNHLPAPNQVGAGCGAPTNFEAAIGQKKDHLPSLVSNFPIHQCTTKAQQDCLRICAQVDCSPLYKKEEIIPVSLDHFETDDDGYLLKFDDWTEEFAALVLSRHRINLYDHQDPNTTYRWGALKLLRELNPGEGNVPLMRHFQKELAAKYPEIKDVKSYLYELFPMFKYYYQAAGYSDPTCLVGGNWDGK